MKKVLTLLSLFSFLFAFGLNGQQFPLYEHDFSISPKIVEPGDFEAPDFNFPDIAVQRSAIDPELAMTFDSILHDHFENLDVAGLSAAVNIQGDIWTGVKGNSSAVDTVNENMAFAIGSVSKTLTSACILQMYEESLLDLEDILYDFLPVFEHVDSSVTIRQLLNHTSGIYNYTNHPNLTDSVFADMERVWTPVEVLDAFMFGPDFPAGTSWNYSNTNYLLQGMIIEEISGNPYHEEIRSRFLEPLGLSTVSLPPFEDYNAEPVHLWFDALGTGNSIDATAAGISINSLYSMAWAAGAYVSTASDMTIWARNLYNGDLLQSSTLTELQTTIPFGTSTGYVGYGLGVFELNGTCYDAWGHGGDIIYSSQVYGFPDLNMSIAVHCNDGAINSNDLLSLLDEFSCAYSEITSTTVALEEDFSLEAHPNPFYETLQVQYHLPEREQVNLLVQNHLGQVVQKKTFQNQMPGQHFYEIGNIELPGIYFISVVTAGEMLTKKVIKQ